MKILHVIAGSLNGGAARGAFWLHEGLRSQGIDSKVLTKFPANIENTIPITPPNRLKRVRLKIEYRIENYFLSQYPDRKNIIFSTGRIGNDITVIPEYKEADIIHLHWINNNMLSIKDIGKMKKPIVWTLRDMWPMTGGCHYPMDCTNYQTGCGNCEQLNSTNASDLSSAILDKKKKSFPKDMQLVGISRWISAMAQNSDLFKKFDIRTISNNINTNDFIPIDKNIAKKILGLDTKKKVILVGSTNIKDFYKGFGKFIEALDSLNTEKYYLCFFGTFDQKLGKLLKFEYKSFGYLNDIISLRLLYSAADVFVSPSIMEAFGKTITESMSCGTPVVCFDATGPKDIVDHKSTGYLATPFDSADLAKGIEWVLDAENYDELCTNARKKVLEKFDSKIVAKQYLKLYKEILNG